MHRKGHGQRPGQGNAADAASWGPSGPQTPRAGGQTPLHPPGASIEAPGGCRGIKPYSNGKPVPAYGGNALHAEHARTRPRSMRGQTCHRSPWAITRPQAATQTITPDERKMAEPQTNTMLRSREHCGTASQPRDAEGDKRRADHHEIEHREPGVN